MSAPTAHSPLPETHRNPPPPVAVPEPGASAELGRRTSAIGRMPATLPSAGEEAQDPPGIVHEQHFEIILGDPKCVKQRWKVA